MPYYRVDQDDSEATAQSVSKHIEGYVKAMGTHPVAAFCVILMQDDKGVWKMDYSSLDLYDDETDLDRWVDEMSRFCANEVTEAPDQGFILWTTSRVSTLEPHSIKTFPSGNSDVEAIVEQCKRFRYGLFSNDGLIDLSDHLVNQQKEVERLAKRKQHDWLTAGIEVKMISDSNDSDDDATKATPTVARKRAKAKAEVPTATEAVPTTPRKKVSKKAPKAVEGKAIPKKVAS